jgi:hypothetical protein
MGTSMAIKQYPRWSRSEDQAVAPELPYSASGCFDGWASAKAGMAMQV